MRLRASTHSCPPRRGPEPRPTAPHFLPSNPRRQAAAAEQRDPGHLHARFLVSPCVFCSTPQGKLGHRKPNTRSQELCHYLECRGSEGAAVTTRLQHWFYKAYLGGANFSSKNSSILFTSVWTSPSKVIKGGLVPGARFCRSAGFLGGRERQRLWAAASVQVHCHG